MPANYGSSHITKPTLKSSNVIRLALLLSGKALVYEVSNRSDESNQVQTTVYDFVAVARNDRQKLFRVESGYTLIVHW